MMSKVIEKKLSFVRRQASKGKIMRLFRGLKALSLEISRKYFDNFPVIEEHFITNKHL